MTNGDGDGGEWTYEFVTRSAADIFTEFERRESFALCLISNQISFRRSYHVFVYRNFEGIEEVLESEAINVIKLTSFGWQAFRCPNVFRLSQCEQKLIGNHSRASD